MFMKKDKLIVNLKSTKSICHRTTFYSIFNTSSSRNPGIQNDLPKLTKIKRMCFFLTNSGQKSLTILISSFFNNYSIEFYK